ncbi:MAG: LPXTG cell wall anchor domain-containing protein [Bryobacterales bacterium]|nr:LPXTG cell wall anchor domain-containing protein [Bryobacterales bacterium]
MDQQTLSTILFIAAGVVLVLYIMRRRKRKMGS